MIMRTNWFAKCLVAMAVFAVSATTYAQDGLKEKMKTLFTVNTTLMGGGTTASQAANLVNVLTSSGMDDAKAQALTSEYMQAQYLNDMIEVVMPYYAGKISNEELDYLIGQYQTETGKKALANVAKGSAAMQSPEVQQYIQNSMMAVMQGREGDSMKAEACSATYKQKFDQYYKISNVGGTITAVLGSLETAFMTQARNDDERAMLRGILDTITKFLTENMQVIALNGFHPEVTEADYDFFITLTSTPAGQKMQECTNAMMADSMNVGTKLIGKFLAWSADK
jgi:hypothetical protein